MIMESQEKRPDFIIIFFSILFMIGVLVMGMCLLTGCSMSFNREEGQVSGDKANKTNFTITSKI